MAWTKANKFSSYEGGEAMGIRALFRTYKKFKSMQNSVNVLYNQIAAWKKFSFFPQIR